MDLKEEGFGTRYNHEAITADIFGCRYLVASRALYMLACSSYARFFRICTMTCTAGRITGSMIGEIRKNLAR